ncbi:GP91 [Caviid betaherpesvirus 2]|uniref:GP91 n=2 Tax=Caviid betaherpesvirus 2 TaxID=33706 RepID=U6H8G0_9BETA|nr:GP91 [Caviid betaherpesvirus 2]AGE11561.1 GP91 [Caviid betaherpesvirus 2]AIL83949.1 GP91 [BAC cloning vector GPN13BACdenovo_preserved(MM)]BAJ78549.1 GP91 [Caviid betaherpesvirus 2]CDI95426.1 GP91 [Caviid herpesvirus 2 str. CIDMTR]
MNEALKDITDSAKAHAAVEELFRYVDSVHRHFGFLFQTDESGLRRVECVASLFDHVAVESVHDVASLTGNVNGIDGDYGLDGGASEG